MMDTSSFADHRLAAFLSTVQRHAAEKSGERSKAETEEYEEHLETQLEHFYGKDWKSQPAAQSAYDSFRHSVNATVPTEWEDPLLCSLINGLASNITSVIPRLGVKLDASLLFGTLNSGHVNAISVKAPGAEPGYLVLFERQLFHFALLFSKAIARALPASDEDGEGQRWAYSCDPEEIARKIRTDPTVGERFLDVVGAYAVAGNPAGAEPYAVEPPYFGLAKVIQDSMQHFVLGHEFAHILLRHHEAASTSRSLVPAVEEEVLDYSWNQEFLADALGARISIEATMRKFEVEFALGYMGADAFFSALNVMDRAVSVLETGAELRRTVGTHPPADQRREFLRLFIEQQAGAELGSEATEAVTLGRAIEHAVAGLWAYAAPQFRAMHERGVRPWRQWHLVDRVT